MKPASLSVQFDDFKTAHLARGFDEVIERQWAPHTVLAEHTHPFAVEALVVQGEMWLTCGSQTRHLREGDHFTLEAEVLHAERYGAQGATYWVARRNLR
jgi:mannose-6-phosphate isomerase-like protein (cupin superfamily)